MSVPSPAAPILLEVWNRSSHHVCFTCRKQFAKPTFSAFLPSRKVWIGDWPVTYLCPQCGQEMTRMGKNFRAPPQQDSEAWEIARRLANAGFKHSYRTRQTYPTRLRDVEAFLSGKVRRSDGERLLWRWQKKEG